MYPLNRGTICSSWPGISPPARVWSSAGGELSRAFQHRDKRHLLTEARRLVEGGALLLLACQPADDDFRAWWPLIKGALNPATILALTDPESTWPAEITPLSFSFAALAAGLQALQPESPSPETVTQPPASEREGSTYHIHIEQGTGLAIGDGAKVVQQHPQPAGASPGMPPGPPSSVAAQRCRDLQENTRESLDLLKAFEDQRRLSSDPKEKRRADREIAELRQQLAAYEAEFKALGCEPIEAEDFGRPEAPAQRPTAPPVTPPAFVSPDRPPAPSTARPAKRTPADEAQTGQSQTPLDAYALIIGIGQYHHIPQLKKTTTDAQDLREVLLARGYPQGNIALLLDDQATKAAINQHLNELAELAKDDTTVLIFFAGHGARWVGGFHPGEYLCPVGTIRGNLRDTAISNDELTTALSAITAQRMVVFLDACHSGGVVGPQQRGALAPVKPGLSISAYDQLSAGKGRVVIASCQPDEVSWELDGMRNGLFTHYLLEGLRGKVADEDGGVRALRLFSYLSRQVPQHKAQHPLLKMAEAAADIVLCQIQVPASGTVEPPEPAPPDS